MSFDPTVYAIPLAALAVAIVLFFTAPWFLSASKEAGKISMQVLVLRSALSAFILLQVADIALHQTVGTYYNRVLMRASLSLFAIISAFLLINITSRIAVAKFGVTRNFDGKQFNLPSYHSRMANMMIFTVLVILLAYTLTEIWGFDSLFERTGFIGLIAASLVLTSTVWLPDLFYGLVLLGSSMAEEGDTIAIPRENKIYIINRLTPFYTLLLDVDNNNRAMIRNSQLTLGRIENLSKRASVEGLRRQAEFKLGYPKLDDRQSEDESLFKRVDKAVNAAFARVVDDPHVKINSNVPFDWSMVEAGDNALRFIVYYHLEALPKTKLTSRIRTHLRATSNTIARLIFEEASMLGLDLATPALVKIDKGSGWPQETLKLVD